MPELDLTFFLAAYGALLSTLGMVRGVYVMVRDDRRIKVSCYVGRALTRVGPPVGAEPHAVLNVVNVGRRVAHIINLSLNLERDEKLAVFPEARPLPWVLEEAQGCVLALPAADLTGFIRDATGLFAADSTGREWRLPKKQFLKLKSDLLELESAEASPPRAKRARAAAEADEPVAVAEPEA